MTPTDIPNSEVARDELSQNAMGGTEMMKYGLHSRLPQEIRDEYQFIHSRVREENLDPNKKKILIIHDMWNDPENFHLKNPSSWDRFERIVFVSQWQAETFRMEYDIPHSKTVVMRNAIEPFVNRKILPKKGEQIRLIYHTTPHRGLNILLSVFDKLVGDGYNIHLDVFSSFKMYGWEERDVDYANLFEFCKNHPNITYHGYQPNKIIRDYLELAHLYAYPCTWPETSCISLIEALSAGCVCLVPDYGALRETSIGCSNLYPYDENVHRHVSLFCGHLSTILEYISDGETFNPSLQQSFINHQYSWKTRINDWMNLFQTIKYFRNN